MQRAVAVLALACALGAGCVGFRPDQDFTPDTTGKPRVTPSYIERGRTIEARGEFTKDGRFRATRIEIEEPDDETTLKGPLSAWQPGKGGAVGGVEFVIDAKSVFTDQNDDPIDPGAFHVGDWVKAECIVRERVRRLRKLIRRERKPGELAELQGPVDHARPSRGQLEIGGVLVRFDFQTPVYWDVEGKAPPSTDRWLGSITSRGLSGLAHLRPFDDEDRRPEDQFTIADRFTIGGEVQYEAEWRRNHDLLTRKRRDRMIHEPSAKLEVSATLTPRVFAFVQGQVSRRIVGFDQERDLDYNTDVDLTEAYLLVLDLPVAGFGLQVGRQDFDQGREWVMDDELDAVRGYLNTPLGLFELSASTRLRDTTPENDDVKNYLLGFHTEPIEDHALFLYWLRREQGSLVDLGRNHFGLSLEGRTRDLHYWLDVGGVYGTEGDARVSGYGFDAMVMYANPTTRFDPSVYAGFAYGSGDDRPGKTDHNFRQTGLNDNNAKLNGVTSFRYLGELMRPNLSNLAVYTAGVGIRPFRKTSIDVVYHHYRQPEPSTRIGRSRLRLNPKGLVSDLGDEFDIIIGLDYFRPMEFEIVLSNFIPGDAFGKAATDAWFGAVQVEYNF